MNLELIRKQARFHAEELCIGDECLYKIGREAGLFSEEDLNQIQSGSSLGSSLRSRTTTWLRRNANELGLTKLK